MVFRTWGDCWTREASDESVRRRRVERSGNNNESHASAQSYLDQVAFVSSWVTSDARMLLMPGLISPDASRTSLGTKPTLSRSSHPRLAIVFRSTCSLTFSPSTSARTRLGRRRRTSRASASRFGQWQGPSPAVWTPTPGASTAEAAQAAPVSSWNAGAQGNSQVPEVDGSTHRQIAVLACRE